MRIKRLFCKYLKDIMPFKSAMLAVSISVIASVCVSAVSESGKQLINDEMDAMGLNGMAVAVFNTSGENVTDTSLLNNISSMKETTVITPVIIDTVEAVFENGMKIDAMGWGINEQASDIVSLNVINGRMIDNQDIESNSFVCLIDQSIAEKVYKRNNICGKKINVFIDNKSAIFEVIGTVKKESDILNNITGNIMPNFLYLPYTTMKSLSLKSNYDQIIFNSTDTTQNAEEFKQKLTKISYRYKNKIINLTNLSQHKSQISSIADTAFLSLFAVSCVAIIVCGISVASSVNTAVFTKQKDIGIKISMGASKLDIIMEFLKSALISCFIGVTAAIFIVFLTFSVAKIFMPYNLILDSLLIVISISATIVLALIFSLIPSYKAAKMPPINALNRE